MSMKGDAKDCPCHSGKPPPKESGATRHFKVVGTERIEIFDNDIVVKPEDRDNCVPCRMEEVLKVFGTENLE